MNQATRIGPLAEVPHVGVERLAAGDAEHDRAEGEEARDAVLAEEARAPCHGLSAAQHLRRLRRSPATPSAAIVTNQTSMIGPNAVPTRAVPKRWTMKSAKRMTSGDRHDEVRRAPGVLDLEPLHGAEHGDRRRDDAVAVEQRGAEEAERDEQRVAASGRRRARFC